MDEKQRYLLIGFFIGASLSIPAFFLASKPRVDQDRYVEMTQRHIAEMAREILACQADRR